MTDKSKTAYNKVLPKSGLNDFDLAFVKGSNFVLQLNFCLILHYFLHSVIESEKVV